MTFKTTKQNLYEKSVVTSTPDFQIFLCGMMMAGISLAPQCHPMKWVLFYCAHFTDEDTWPLRTLRLWVTVWNGGSTYKDQGFLKEVYMFNFDTLQTFITVSCNELKSEEEKNHDYQWWSKTDHAADGPTLTLAEKQVGEPPLRLLGAPLHDLFGLEPSWKILADVVQLLLW